ncbi:MAG TPA: hypothetical protein VHC43_08605 [Mycobacteriales bacterium]|nr:hypothetical protein [Mycobacteriales bacterium]
MRVPAVAVRFLAVAALLALPSISAAPAVATTPTAAGVHGADISWPNCPKGMGIPKRRTEGQPMPTRGASFVIVGLTNGPGFYPNPCLGDQLSWVSAHQRLLAAYAMTTYPRKWQIRRYGTTGPYDATASRGALRNAAYAEAGFNLSTMTAAAMTVPMIWVDVEPYPTFPWTKSHAANRAVVRSVIRAYRDAGYRVGIYTYPNGWKDVVGSWRLPSLPTWSTIGGGRAAHAERACGHGPSGGEDWIMQWWTNHRDKDLICPAGAEQGATIFASASA